VELGEATTALRGLATHGRGTSGSVTLEAGERVAHLRIDNPAAKGAITLQMMVQLADAIAQLRTWNGSLVVLSGSDDKVFCSGGHLGEVSRAIDSTEAARTMSLAMTSVLDALLELPAVSVAAIDGLAIGGGAEITTACDYRVAGPRAAIHFIHARLGIAPGWGGAGRLVRLLGRRCALRVLTGARPLSPGEATSLGLVDHRCPGKAVDGTLRWFEELVTLPPVAIRAIKRQVVAAGPARRDPEAEAELFAEVWGGPAHQAALEKLDRHRR
jgi:ethylmalonyl-CoA/methylmalonyl-CoA decarboxylase